MPNHVTNILTLDGPLPVVKAIYHAISPYSFTDEELKSTPAEPPKPGDPIFKPATKAQISKRKSGSYEIDFNKIVPMPPQVYRGNVGSEEQAKYGKENWYDWSIANWGTKWNAYDMEKIDDYSMTFNTAWSMPEPVIRALSQRFPDIVVQIKWADEDIGSNCGEIHYKNGEEIFTNVPDDLSKEAYELSFEIQGGEDSYRYDEEHGTYVYIEESRINIYQATTSLKKIFENIPLSEPEDTVRRGSFKSVSMKNQAVDPDKIEEQGVMPYANDENMIGMTTRSSVDLRHRPTVLSKDRPDAPKEEVEEAKPIFKAASSEQIKQRQDKRSGRVAEYHQTFHDAQYNRDVEVTLYKERQQDENSVSPKYGEYYGKPVWFVTFDNGYEGTYYVATIFGHDGYGSSRNRGLTLYGGDAAGSNIGSDAMNRIMDWILANKHDHNSRTNEAQRVFKPATKGMMKKRLEADWPLAAHETRETCGVCGRPGVYDHEDDEAGGDMTLLTEQGYTHWDCYNKLLRDEVKRRTNNEAKRVFKPATQSNLKKREEIFPRGPHEDLEEGETEAGDWGVFIDRGHFVDEWGFDSSTESYLRDAFGSDPTYFVVIENGHEVHGHGWIENGKITQWG